MPYFCSIHRTTGGVPYFEVLPQSERERALNRAAELLADRPDGERAEVWEDETLIQTLSKTVAA